LSDGNTIQLVRRLRDSSRIARARAQLVPLLVGRHPLLPRRWPPKARSRSFQEGRRRVPASAPRRKHNGAPGHWRALGTSGRSSASAPSCSGSRDDARHRGGRLERGGAGGRRCARGWPAMWGAGGLRSEDFSFFSLFRWRIEEDLCIVKNKILGFFAK
jgi:hypothetical protein